MPARAVASTRNAFRTLLLAGSMLMAFASMPVHAATITVTGMGDAIAVDGLVTLREAIASVNAGANVNADVVAVGAYGASDTIVFNIPGAGVRTIAPASALNVTQPVLINGYTQPGASANTNGPTQGTNAVLLIELDLTGASGGINVTGGGSVIRGLVLNRSTSNAITLGSNNNVVAGNFIGTNPTGATAGPGNTGDGVFVTGTGNRIGGTVPGDRNLISANGWGLRIGNGGNIVQGNLIGTIAAGTFALGNLGQGIGASGASNTIGGGSPAERNVVAANGQHGILVLGSNSLVAGNYVGTEVGGGSGLGNGQDGIVIAGPNNTVGGLAGLGNLVSGNGSHGINITNQSPGGATVVGNIVGATASGTLPIGGQIDGGIEIGPLSNANRIARNTLAFNLGPGIYVAGQGPTGGNGNTFSENSINGNGLLGIRLGTPRNSTATPNDTGDADTGPNGLQNYPVVTSASIAAGVLTVGGTFNSLPNTQFTIEVFVSQFCDGNLFGEGQTFLGNFGIGTNGAGDASFGPLNFPGVPAGQAVVTMTATNDATGDTSEFSACFLASGPLPSITINDVSQLEGNSGTTPFVFTVSISASASATVNFATANGTATAGSDYAAASGTVTFTSGGPLTQTVTVLVNGDTVVEPNETFFVNLSGATGATIGDAQGLGTILNDDAPPVPTITINDVSQLEGNAGTTPFVFTVTLSSTANATVNFATANGTATAGSDYAAASGTVTFTSGGPLTQTVTVLVNGDTVVEPNETFFVNLSGATGATIGDAQGLGTILNDDALPVSVEPIPTLGEWQLVALMFLLAATGALARHRRHDRRRPRGIGPDRMT